MAFLYLSPKELLVCLLIFLLILVPVGLVPLYFTRERSAQYPAISSMCSKLI